MDAKMFDKLDMMIALGAKDCGEDDVDMLDHLDTSGVSLDKVFYHKKVRIIKKHKRAPTVLALKKGILRAAVVLMVVMSLGFTSIMAVTPMRKAVFQVIIEWHENYLTIHFEQTDKKENVTGGKEESETTDTNENPPVNESIIIPPAVIEEVRKPTNLADNIVEDVIMQNKAFVCIDYYIDSELAYTFMQALLSDSDIYIDSEGAVTGTIDINGNLGTVIQHTGFSAISIIWCDGEYVYQMISQTASFEVLLAVCRSVQ